MNGMIDPRTQWIIHEEKERELLMEIEWRQRFVNEKLHLLAKPWYTQAAEWISQVVLHIQPGKQSDEKGTSTCCPAYAGSSPSR